MGYELRLGRQNANVFVNSTGVPQQDALLPLMFKQNGMPATGH